MELYFDYIHDQFHSMYHKASFMDDVINDRVPHIVLYAIFALAARFSTDEFFALTNCAIFLPTEHDADTVSVVGPPADVGAALEKAFDLAMEIKSSNFDAAKLHRHAAGAAPAYARDMSRYLRQKREIERLESAHGIHINTPYSEGVITPWELYAREAKKFMNAQKEITSIINSYPPSRLATVPVDSFYHPFLKKELTHKIRDDYGVFLVVPDPAQSSHPVLLVYEGKVPAGETFQVSQNAPSPQEVKAFQQGLSESKSHILDLLNKQEKITATSFDVPTK